MKRKSLAALLAVLLLLPAAGCGSLPKYDETYNKNNPSAESGAPQPGGVTATEAETLPETTEPAADASVSFLAVGDNLVQKRVYEAAANHAQNGEAYDFSYCYGSVADVVAAADIAYINQETIIANDQYEISGSNFNFNSPTELGDTLVDMGFDIICMANNHALDKGTGGLSATLDYWDGKQAEAGTLRIIGAYRDYQDMCNYRISEVNGMTIGYLAYTEHINGYSIPADSELKVPLLDVTLIEQQITELSGMVDCVVVSAHWGDEDTHTVRDTVKSLAADMIEWGADVIIGTHSHTMQTMEYITRSDGTQGFVFYSLGNFISAQTDAFNMLGGMAQFNLVKDGATGTITVEDVQVTPVITHYDDGSLSNLRMYPYYMYTDELVAAHGLPYSPWGTAKNWNRDVITSLINNNIPEEFQKLTE